MTDEHQSQPSAGLPTRIIVKEFTHNNLVIQVQKTLTYRPYYAIIIGTPNKNNPGQINRGIFPLRFEGIGQINDVNINLDIFQTLMQDALSFARDCRQQDEDERIEQQIEREHQDANRGKPVTKKTGKTERNKRKKQHASQE
jgi:hypothetical protein